MNATGILILTASLLVVLFADRRWAILAILLGTLFLSQGQRVVIFGTNVFAIRFIELTAFVRVVAKREFDFRKLEDVDRLLVLLYAYNTIVFLIRSSIDYAYQIGVCVDALLVYFAFRGLLGKVTGEDIRWLLARFLLLLIPYTCIILWESFTNSNLFTSMGGIELSGAAWVRGGRIRAQGSFRHASLLGTLGASFIPLYIGMAFDRPRRILAFLGLLLCCLIVWASNSGGPLNCAAVGVVGWLFWRLRFRMSLVRRVAIVTVLVLGLFMKAPIWYLPAKASSLTGGDGWHRSYLMDVAAGNFSSWGLAGMPIANTSEWFPYVIEVTGAADITNQFISLGISSGFLAIVLFLTLLGYSFRRVGRAMKMMLTAGSGGGLDQYIIWALGVTVMAHIFNWLGITYFDQTYVIWYFHLALLVGATALPREDPFRA